MGFQLSMRFLFVLLLLNLPDASVLGDCRCNPPEKDETTHWVGNQVEIFVEKNSYKILRGTVTISANGKSLGGALVEVFSAPEYLLSTDSYSRGKPEQRRVAACRTGVDGKFCFLGLASGKYELRASSDDTRTGWNATQVYVVVDRMKGKGKDLRVEMTLGL